MAKWLCVAILASLNSQAESSDAPIGVKAFPDRRNPPSYVLLDETDSARIHLGQSVFETQWVAAGAPGIGRRIGLGPLFNATSCGACHNDGERGPGPAGDGPVPTSLVIHLESSLQGDGPRSGDPVYGRVLNTAALAGVQAEGAVTVRYSEIAGYYYPFGGRWSLRVPHYHLVGLSHGPLASTTVIKPRLAPALFGVGLLEAVPGTAITEGTAKEQGERNYGAPAWHLRESTRSLGRFGWQGDEASIRDQAAEAFAHDMGLTTNERPNDDCTPAEAECWGQPNGGTPEVTADLLDALAAFLRTLAVPLSPTHADDDSIGPALFADTGCAVCHRPQLPVEMPDANGLNVFGVIAPYTDLRLHDLGNEMADERASGTKVISRWRTAPLWGLGYRLKVESHPTFLHDGRARSTEEAILWHSGEARYSKRKFMDLGPHARGALLHWLESL